MDISEYSDDDLKQLMEKYKEKKMRYDLMYNEATNPFGGRAREEVAIWSTFKSIISRCFFVFEVAT